VNHFTSLINSHEVVELDDIEKTSKALEAAGVPMKTEIEGEAGAPLRQTATQAVLSSVAVMDAGKETTVEWPYAYFELAQRDPYMLVFHPISPPFSDFAVAPWLSFHSQHPTRSADLIQID